MLVVNLFKEIVYYRVSLLIGSIAIVLGLPTSVIAQEGNPASFSQRSCDPFGNPLDKSTLISRREQADGWRGGTSVESAFENYSIASFSGFEVRPNPLNGGLRFNSLLRFTNTGGASLQVVPDGLANVPVAIRYFYRVFGVRFNFTLTTTFENTQFWEAKTNQGTPLGPEDGSGPWQIGGFIDAVDTARNIEYEAVSAVIRASGGRGISDPPFASLVFLSPSSTRIAETTIQLASDRRVLLYRSVICNNVGGTLGINDVVMGKSILLNENIVPSNQLNRFRELSGGAPGSLVIVNPDDDPPGGGHS